MKYVVRHLGQPDSNLVPVTADAGDTMLGVLKLAQCEEKVFTLPI